ncbi:MAG: hypothetical protein FJ054_12370 [Cyanobacteria bacterium M_surface_10_m2_119]|nr:hypothetical protein [Cyanobacteria bacterium M_surface_10_m2_119]
MEALLAPPSSIVDLTSSNSAEILSEIDSFSASGGTNYEAAFLQAASDISSLQSTYSSAEGYQTITYFLTDGDPTYRLDGDGNPVNDRSGSSTSPAELREAIQAFEQVSSKSVVYGIGIGTSTNVDYLQFFDNTSNPVFKTVSVPNAFSSGSTNVTGPAAAPDIVTSGDQLDAILQGGSTTVTVNPVGDDVINGGSGDDAILGDSIFSGSIDKGWAAYVAANPALTTDVAKAEDIYANLTSNNPTYAAEGSVGGNDIIDGGAGNDVIFGQGGNDRITGGLGADRISGGTGADRFVYSQGDGNGVDTITDFAGGSDKIVFLNATNVVQAVSGSQVTFTVTWIDLSTESITINFVSSAVASAVSPSDLLLEVAPVALDLNRDGEVAYLPALSDSVPYFVSLGGVPFLAWTFPDDGILVYDYNADGLVTEAREVVLTMWGSDPAVSTDLQALAAYFDGDFAGFKDGILDASDLSWASFGVWQDVNLDGVSNEGEFVTLSALGIESLSLSYSADSVYYIAAEDDAFVYGQMVVGYADGSIGLAEDVAFATALPQQSITQPESVISESPSDNPQAPLADVTIPSADAVDLELASVADLVEQYVAENAFSDEVIAEYHQELALTETPAAADPAADPAAMEPTADAIAALDEAEALVPAEGANGIDTASDVVDDVYSM